MQKIEIETLIVGAGPAGMAAALELAKAGKQFLVLEKAPEVGGLSKTYQFVEGNDVFYTDNGPHRFFSKNPYLYEMIGGLLNEEWITVRRQTRQFIEGKFYDYPVNPTQALRNLGVLRAIQIILDYGIAKIQYGLFKKNIVSFEDYVVANFGRTLGRFNMINYTEKIWGIPASTIHPDWAAQRIKGLNLFSVAKEAFLRVFLGSSKNKPKSLVDTFYYPRKGTGLIYETIREKLEAQGYQFICNAEIARVHTVGNKITGVTARTQEGEIEITCKYLVESVPIADFIRMLDTEIPQAVTKALSELRYRHQTYLFVTLDKESVTDDQWIYFPSKDVPIGRMSEMKNFSDFMCPKGKTSLFIEYFCFEDEPVWKMDADALFAYTLPYLEKAGFVKKSEVRKYYVIRQKNVYPIYDLGYEPRLHTIKSFLDGFENLFYIGRPGRFRYNNQDHSLEMGIMAAECIVTGKKPDFDAIGAEKEYYEKGDLKATTSESAQS